jgi:hypothetical protein
MGESSLWPVVLSFPHCKYAGSTLILWKVAHEQQNHRLNQLRSPFTNLYLFIPATPYVGRTTRSGNELSPWMFGPPIRTHKPYSIAVALKAAVEDRLRREDAGDESEDEREVESPPLTPPPSSPGSPLTPLTPLGSPLLCDASLPPRSDSTPLPTASTSSLPPCSPLTPLASPLLCDASLPATSGMSFPTACASSLPLPPSTKFSRKAVGKAPRPRHRNTNHTKGGKKSRQLRRRDAENAHAAVVIKKVALRHRRNSDPVRTTYNTSTDAPITQPGWVAHNTNYVKEHLSLETLTGPDYNMIVVPWDGV